MLNIETRRCANEAKNNHKLLSILQVLLLTLFNAISWGGKMQTPSDHLACYVRQSIITCTKIMKKKKYHTYCLNILDRHTWARKRKHHISLTWTKCAKKTSTLAFKKSWWCRLICQVFFFSRNYFVTLLVKYDITANFAYLCDMLSVFS